MTDILDIDDYLKSVYTTNGSKVVSHESTTTIINEAIKQINDASNSKNFVTSPFFKKNP